MWGNEYLFLPPPPPPPPPKKKNNNQWSTRKINT